MTGTLEEDQKTGQMNGVKTYRHWGVKTGTALYRTAYTERLSLAGVVTGHIRLCELCL